MAVSCGALAVTRRPLGVVGPVLQHKAREAQAARGDCPASAPRALASNACVPAACVDGTYPTPEIGIEGFPAEGIQKRGVSSWHRKRAFRKWNRGSRAEVPKLPFLHDALRPSELSTSLFVDSN